MENEYQFAEAEELAKKAKNRLSVAKITVEYLFTRDEYNSDELSYCYAIERSWRSLSTSQKIVFFMYTVQGFTFSSIAKSQGYTPQNAHQLFIKACKTIQKNI
jgi:DNA-directed RNA polymerase specialized sigma24 family protein